MGVLGNAVSPANGADAFVPFEDAFAKMARIGPQTPFFHAEGGTKCLASGRYFEPAPAAETAAVRTLG